MAKDNPGQKRKHLRALKPGSSEPSRRQRQQEAFLAKWRAVDWSKSDVELAEEMGLRSGGSIGAVRRRIGAPKSPRWHQLRAKFREPNLVKWRSWDWSKQDVVLAREAGLSRERIRQIRQLLGAPRSPHHGSDSARRRQNILALQWAAENLDRLRGMSGAELEQKHGYNRDSRVYAFLKAKGVLRNGNFNRKYRWDLMNLELPNGVLERIWKLPLYRAYTHRWQKRLPAPRWKLIGRRARLPRRGELPAYRRAVQAEERKAAKYFAEIGQL
jgi:hypothetical protein